MKTVAKTVKEQYEHRKQLTEQAKQRRDALLLQLLRTPGIAGGTEAQGESYFEARFLRQADTSP
jgi:hypothetical protein